MPNCILRHFDTPLLIFTYDKGGLLLHVDKVFDTALLPFPLRQQLANDTFSQWVASRILPHGFRVLRRGHSIRTLFDSDPFGLAIHTHALSLTDPYWIDFLNAHRTWKEVNLYDNNFSRDIAEIALGGNGRTDTLDLSPEYTTKGNMRKCWERRADGIYLLKTDNRAGLASETIMEWYAAQVLEAMHIPHVRYDLEEREIRGRTCIVCSCPLLTSMQTGFVDAADFARSQGLIKPTESFLQFTLGTIPWQLAMAGAFGQEEYADMMIADFIIGNSDHHLENFGKLVDNRTGNLLGAAPLFDHGRSFLAAKDAHGVSAANMCKWLNEEAELSCYMETRELLAHFLRERHGDILERLTSFQFENHPVYPLREENISMLNTFVRHQSIQALAILHDILPRQKSEDS